MSVALLAVPASDALAATGNGGVAAVAPPTINAVKCAAGCMPGGRVQNGGRIKLRGKKLADVTKVVFTGGPGRADDVSVSVSPSGDSGVAVPVPYKARSGRLQAWAGKLAHTTTRSAVQIMPPPAPTPQVQLTPVPGPADPGAPALETSTSRSLLAIDEAGGVVFSFRLASGEVASAQVTLVRLDDGALIQTWNPPVPPPGQVASVAWDGLVGGQPAPDGRYAFRLVAASAAGARAQNAVPGDGQRDAFDLRPALFPVLGSHNFGGASARFGASRSGHTHQGQDVLAACGTPLIAARGGVVKAKRYQSAAGNYIVIDGQNTGVDYGYMHLAQPSPYNVGERVHTGDQIGVVGETGDATACHLHFEEWSAPGWYTGGQPFDPLPDLQAWDAYS
jgi:murein DD-endopeptidase MepM/ murein hydrolase activator NlpD